MSDHCPEHEARLAALGDGRFVAESFVLFEAIQRPTQSSGCWSCRISPEKFDSLIAVWNCSCCSEPDNAE